MSDAARAISTLRDHFASSDPGGYVERAREISPELIREEAQGAAVLSITALVNPIPVRQSCFTRIRLAHRSAHTLRVHSPG